MAQLIASGYLAQIGLGSSPTALASLYNWQINDSNSVQTAIASSTNEMEMKIAGNYDWTATAQFFGYQPPAFPGDIVTFSGYTDGTANTRWTSGSSGAIVQEVTINCDVESATPYTGSITFAQCASALTATTGTLSDSSLPEVWSPASRKMTWAGADLNVRGWTLTLKCQTPEYVDTATGGKVYRVKGNKSASGSFKLFEAAPATVLRAGAIEAAKFYVTASAYWQVDYCILGQSSQTADRASGAVVGVDHTFEYTGYKVITNTPTKGTIVDPGSTAYAQRSPAWFV